MCVLCWTAVTVCVWGCVVRRCRERERGHNSRTQPSHKNHIPTGKNRSLAHSQEDDDDDVPHHQRHNHIGITHPLDGAMHERMIRKAKKDLAAAPWLCFALAVPAVCVEMPLCCVGMCVCGATTLRVRSEPDKRTAQTRQQNQGARTQSCNRDVATPSYIARTCT